MEHTNIDLDTEQAVVLPEREALSHFAYVDANNGAFALDLFGGSATAIARQTITVTQ